MEEYPNRRARFTQPTRTGEDAYYEVFNAEVGHMNRAARRTTKGRLLVAEAQVKALAAQVEFLKEQQVLHVIADAHDKRLT